MTRRYDSSGRKRAAEQTRKSIIEAALRLHWKGITGYESLAREAGCSVPSVRKHYPTKEDLYRDCTQTFADSLAMPDLNALGRITDPARRLEQAVSELCRIHDALFGYAWFGAHAGEGSPTLSAVMQAYDELADSMTEIVVQKDSSRYSVVRGFLDYLTYRALRLSGGLEPESARQELIAAIRPLVTEGE